MVSVMLTITGRVQGVGFRASARQEATSLGLRGWVANTDGGGVRLLAAGDESAVARFERWCRDGPSAAGVDHVERSEAGDDAEASLPEGFEIR